MYAKLAHNTQQAYINSDLRAWLPCVHLIPQPFCRFYRYAPVARLCLPPASVPAACGPAADKQHTGSRQSRG